MWVCLKNYLDRTLFLIGCYFYWGKLNDSLSQDTNRLLMYLSLVPVSCVVPIWYRISMVESEERPFSRPHSRGLFKSTKIEAKTKIRMTIMLDRHFFWWEIFDPLWSTTFCYQTHYNTYIWKRLCHSRSVALNKPTNRNPKHCGGPRLVRCGLMKTYIFGYCRLRLLSLIWKQLPPAKQIVRNWWHKPKIWGLGSRGSPYQSGFAGLKYAEFCSQF